MSEKSVVIQENAQLLAEAAADWIERSAQKAIAQRGRFLLALSGGSTPEQAYLKLASADHRARIDWSRWHIFFGDERFVPPDDPRSNLAMSARALLWRVPVPYGNVLPISTQFMSAAESAEAYCKMLSGFFGISEKSPPPRLDLILLGLGDDGHTASIFPGKTSASVKDRWYTSSPPGVLPPPVERITATLPMLNAGREILFLVAGEKKAAIVKEVLENPQAAEKYPAAMIEPFDGQLTWLLDQPAASRLNQP